jgi:hypothetical protein
MRADKSPPIKQNVPEISCSISRGRADRALPPSGLLKIFGDNAGVPSRLLSPCRRGLAGRDRLYQRARRFWARNMSSAFAAQSPEPVEGGSRLAARPRASAGPGRDRVVGQVAEAVQPGIRRRRCTARRLRLSYGVTRQLDGI